MAIIDITGACDLHIHTAPDAYDRIADDVRMAEICRDAGMRAIGLKAHIESTASRAYHTEKQVPGIKVLGGVTLNWHVGGINPSAVDGVLKLGGRIVWMPTYHSKHHEKIVGSLGSYGYQGSASQGYSLTGITIFDENGKLIPEIYPILEMIKEHDVILGTSHLSPKEGLALLKAAKEVGCRRVVVTHPFFYVPDMTVEEVKQAVDLGGIVEFCASAPLNPIPRHIDFNKYVDAVKLCGAENFIIGTDCGQRRKTYPPETIRMFAQTLHMKGVSETDIHKMTCDNYDRLIDF